MKKTGYPLAPMVLAIVLGDKAEEAFRQSLLASGGHLSVFFSNGLVSTIMVLGLVALFWGVISDLWSKVRGQKKAAAWTAINLLRGESLGGLKRQQIQKSRNART